MSDFGLGDSWKLHHPHEQKYSYISQAHHSFTRTDFFIVSNTLHSDISERWICSKMISDHSPVFGHFKKNYQPQSITGWIFNKSLLSDQDFIDFLERDWESFVEITDSSNTLPALPWEIRKGSDHFILRIWKNDWHWTGSEIKNQN